MVMQGSCPKPACMHTLPSLTYLLGATHANSKHLHGGGLVHLEGNTQSCKLLWEAPGVSLLQYRQRTSLSVPCMPTYTAGMEGPHGTLLLGQCPSAKGL